MFFFGLLLAFVVVIAASFSLYYSFKSRSYKKQGQGPEMRFYQAKVNVALGTMLISMAVIQLFTFPETTGWRIGVGIAFLLLGGINFIAGIRNYRLSSNQLNEKYKSES